MTSGDHGHPHDHGSTRGPLADASARLARTADAPAIGLVQEAVFREALTGHAPDDVLEAINAHTLAASWRSALESPAPTRAHAVLVALAGAQVAGFAAVGPATSADLDTDEQLATTGEISVLGVHPHARRQGHGSRLLNACVDTLRGSGHTSVEAWAVAGDLPTRQFLERSGFAPDGAWRDRQVGPDDDDLLREVRLVADIRT